MKKIFKKNQVIITALAIMIAVAGYINYSDNHLGIDKTLKKASTSTADDKSKETADADGIVEDIDSLDYDLTDESALLEENAAAENGDTNTQDRTRPRIRVPHPQTAPLQGRTETLRTTMQTAKTHPLRHRVRQC